MDKAIQYQRYKKHKDTNAETWAHCEIGDIPVQCSHCGGILVTKLVNKSTTHNKEFLLHYKYYNYVCKGIHWWDLLWHPAAKYRRVEITQTATNWMEEHIKIFQHALNAGRDKEEIKQRILAVNTSLEACEIIDGLNLNDKEKL